MQVSEPLHTTITYLQDQSVGGLSIIDGEHVSIDLVVFPLSAGNIQTFSSYPQGNVAV